MTGVTDAKDQFVGRWGIHFGKSPLPTKIHELLIRQELDLKAGSFWEPGNQVLFLAKRAPVS